jgi:hypothetical protein
MYQPFFSPFIIISRLPEKFKPATRRLETLLYVYFLDTFEFALPEDGRKMKNPGAFAIIHP